MSLLRLLPLPLLLPLRLCTSQRSGVDWLETPSRERRKGGGVSITNKQPHNMQVPEPPRCWPREDTSCWTPRAGHAALPLLIPRARSWFENHAESQTKAGQPAHMAASGFVLPACGACRLSSHVNEAGSLAPFSLAAQSCVTRPTQTNRHDRTAATI